MQNLLPVMKGYLPWLKDVDSQALKHACRRVDAAYKRFFKKQGGYPRFHHKRDAMQSYTTTNAASIHHKAGKVSLPCLGWIRTRDKRKLPENASICHATVTRDHGLYFVSITYKMEVPILKPKLHKTKVLGLDYKSDGLYVDSKGHCLDMPHWYRLSEGAIGWEQRKLSRKIGARKGERPSRRFLRQRERLFKKTRHAANQRMDFLHKTSASIAKKHDAICVEDLNLMAMANRGFRNGKATLDNGYGAFLWMLEYKLAAQGKPLIRVSRWYPSSQLCNACGERNPLIKDLRIRAWICPKCGRRHDRDINAARNIRDEGLRLLREQAPA